MHYDVSQYVEKAIRTGLPVGRRSRSRPEGYRQAGVLVPIVRTEAGYELLFTRRTEEVETHKGQVSFPGGVIDPSDKDIVDTALREAEEEIGVERSQVNIIGVLDDLITPTGFLITPVVGYMASLPVLNPNPLEVAEAFHIPLEFFLDPANSRMEKREVDGKVREVWFFDSGKHTIWGATAVITRSLLMGFGLL